MRCCSPARADVSPLAPGASQALPGPCWHRGAPGLGATGCPALQSLGRRVVAERGWCWHCPGSAAGCLGGVGQSPGLGPLMTGDVPSVWGRDWQDEAKGRRWHHLQHRCREKGGPEQARRCCRARGPFCQQPLARGSCAHPSLCAPSRGGLVGHAEAAGSADGLLSPPRAWLRKRSLLWSHPAFN